MEEQAIRFGLLPISNVGMQAVKAILKGRIEKTILDLFQLVVQLYPELSKKALESLIKAGACDHFGEDRATLLATVDDAIEFAQKIKEFQEETAGLFKLDLEAPDYQKVEPYTDYERLEFEKEVLGFYLSGHPLERYEQTLRSKGRITIREALAHSGKLLLQERSSRLNELERKKVMQWLLRH
nr:hypothetical protein [Bacillus sp. JCM 19034]